MAENMLFYRIRFREFLNLELTQVSAVLLHQELILKVQKITVFKNIL